MSFFDKLKNLFKRPKKPEKKPPKPKPKKPAKIPKISKKAVAEALKLMIIPQITEKATDLKTQDKYVFKVSHIASKTQIKRVIEGLYGVKVLDINIINIHRKARRIGRASGFKPGYKKAVVTLAPGEKIEIVKGV